MKEGLVYVEPPLMRWSRVLAIGMVLVAAALVGATTVSVLNPVEWRGKLEAARSVLEDRNASDEQRRAAILTILRHNRMDAALVREVADGPGKAGSDAREAIAQMRQEWAK